MSINRKLKARNFHAVECLYPEHAFKGIIIEEDNPSFNMAGVSFFFIVDRQPTISVRSLYTKNQFGTLVVRDLGG